MALINKLDNTASVTYNGNSINSNTVTTPLLLAPTILKAVDKLTASVGDTLTFTIPSIPALGTASLQFQAKIVGGTV